MIRNPVLPGFNPDPSILRVGEDYFIAVSTFEWFPGIAIYHSRDLANWNLRTHALTDERSLDLRRLPSAKGVWAPCLTYDREAGLYYLAYSLMYSHNARYFDADNFLVTSPSVDGPWSDPVYLHSVGFDPSFLHDRDGRKYVACLEWETRDGPGRPGGIVLQEYDPIHRKMTGPLREIWKGGTRRGCVEGPHLYRREGRYYLFCAEGGTGYGHCVTVARADSPWGPYEGDPENPILTAAEDFDELQDDWFLKPHRYNPASPLQKPGHASWVETPGGEHYLAHLCARPILPELRCTLGRETALQKAFWTADGWLRLADGGKLPRLEVPEPRETAASNPSACGTEDFDGPWNIHLVSPRRDRRLFASTEERPGRLRLHGRQTLCSLDTTALVARRLGSLRAAASAAMEFDPPDFRCCAGLAAYYDNMNYRLLRVTRREEGGPRLLDLLALVNGVRTEYPCGAIPDGELRMGLAVWDRELRFYAAEGNGAPLEAPRGEPVGPQEGAGEWRSAGPAFDVSELSDEFCKYGEFTGTFVGLACVDARSRDAYADFDWFDYREYPD